MKKSLLIIRLFVLVVCAGGCVVVVNEETRETRGHTHLPADRSIAEIDAVSNLSFESDRKQGYKRIAQRQGLSAEAQVHLVETALGKLAFDSAKEEVLLTLIENPDFCHAAEQAILEDLNKLAFENSKKKILEAISKRKASAQERKARRPMAGLFPNLVWRTIPAWTLGGTRLFKT